MRFPTALPILCPRFFPPGLALSSPVARLGLHDYPALLPRLLRLSRVPPLGGTWPPPVLVSCANYYCCPYLRMTSFRFIRGYLARLLCGALTPSDWVNRAGSTSCRIDQRVWAFSLHTFAMEGSCSRIAEKARTDCRQIEFLAPGYVRFW